jgi:general secretion pathway protein N
MKARIGPLPAALSALALLLLALLGWLLSAPGPAPQWDEPARPDLPANVASAISLPPAPTLQSLANTWQAPLFSPNRQPDQANRQAPVAKASLAGVRLSGIVINGPLRVALLKQDGRDVSVREGAKLANGWLLKRVDPLSVQFEYQGQVQTLQLPAPRVPAAPQRPPVTRSP